MSDHLDRLKSALAGRYEIEQELGMGGMATVYRAHDVRHDRSVAIKVLRPDLAASVGSERFLREIRIAANLSHPHILPLHDSGNADGLLYFVMPYVEGETLRNRLRGGPLPVSEAARLLRQVVDAVAFAHKRGIVHRDIKPDNVMLTERHALVTDFGVAKAVTGAAAAQQVTSFGVAVGTPAYMAPEQAAADADIDHRADIYALGVMAYEMLTGRPPFEGGTSQAVMAAHVTEPPAPVTDHRPEVPEWLAGIVMRCLEKEPADRWQSAEDVRAELETHATPTGVITPVGRGTTISAEAMLRRSHPARVLALFSLGAAAVLGVTYGITIGLGLPSWVFGAAAGIVAAGLPVAMLTGRTERRRASVRAGGSHWASGERGLTHWLTWQRAAAGGGVAFAALGVVAAAYMALRFLGIGPVGTLVASGVLQERERLVLAEFENRTTDSALGEAVTELFRIDLAQSPAVTVLEPAQVAQVLQRMERDPAVVPTTELALEVAQREGLKAIITGEILPVGSGFVVSAKLVAAGSGEALWAGRQSAVDPGGLIEAVDRLSASLRERIGESLRTIRADAPLAQVTTRSTAALRLYAQADRAINQGDYRRAQRTLEEAIAEDSNFAMAHRKLAILLLNLDQDPERRKAAFTTAHQLRERLTERERYLAEAAYYRYVQNDMQASSDVYQTLLEKYPTDRIALNNLSVNYLALGRPEDAAELQRRSLDLGGAPAATYSNAIETSYALGRGDTARALLEQFDAQYPDNPQVPVFRAVFAAAAFDYPTAERLMREFKVTQRANPLFDMQASMELGTYALIQGRVAEAHGLVKEGYDLQAQHGFEFIREPWEVFQQAAEAAVSLRLAGDPTRALAALDRGVRSGGWRSQEPEDRPYLDYAMLYAEAGRPARARELVAQYRARPDEDRPERRAMVHGVEGAIAVAEGRPADAIREYQAFRDSLPQCPLCGLAELGRAFEAAGQPDSAAAKYERYLTAPMLTRSGLDNLNLAPILLRLGELHEELGNREKAVGFYDRFIELWSDADPTLQPRVVAAKVRMARLLGEG